MEKKRPVLEECPCVDVDILRICPVRSGPKASNKAQSKVIMTAFCVELGAFWLPLEQGAEIRDQEGMGDAGERTKDCAEKAGYRDAVL